MLIGSDSLVNVGSCGCRVLVGGFRIHIPKADALGL